MNRMEFYGALNKYKDTNSSLEHKQSALYGKQRANAKYIRREGTPGHYTYIYKEDLENKDNGKKLQKEEWEIDDYIKAYNDEEKRINNLYKDVDNIWIGPTIHEIEEYENGKCTAQDVIDYMDSSYYDLLSKEYGEDLQKLLDKAQAEDDAEEDEHDKDEVDRFIKKIKKRTDSIQEEKNKKIRMTVQNRQNNEQAGKYAEEDRWTDYNDKRERNEALTKFGKEMGLDENKKKLLNAYIKSNDYDDLHKLESALSSTEKAVLQGTLLGLQKESFMGHRIRKDGSLR